MAIKLPHRTFNICGLRWSQPPAMDRGDSAPSRRLCREEELCTELFIGGRLVAKQQRKTRGASVPPHAPSRWYKLVYIQRGMIIRKGFYHEVDLNSPQSSMQRILNHLELDGQGISVIAHLWCSTVLALRLQAPNFDNIPIVFQNVKIVALQVQRSKLGKLGASRNNKILTDFKDLARCFVLWVQLRQFIGCLMLPLNGWANGPWSEDHSLPNVHDVEFSTHILQGW